MPIKRFNLLDANIILIQSKEQFDAISTNKAKRNKIFAQKNKIKNIQPIFNNNEKIIIPRWGKVPESQQFKTQKSLVSSNIQKSGYFRLRLENNLPNPFAYQITEQDETVVNIFKQKYVFPQQMRFKFEAKHLIQVFKHCQQIQYSQDIQIPKNIDKQVWISSSILNLIGNGFNQQYKHLLSDLIMNLVNYWKLVRKEKNNLPLIRTYQQKQETSNYFQNIYTPFKYRYPFILDPKQKIYQLKSIGAETNKQQEQIKIIQSFEKWGQLVNIHQTKWRQFLKCVKIFHSLSESYGFICQHLHNNIFNKNKSNLTDKKLKNDKNVEEVNLSMNESRIQIRSLKSKKHQQSKLYNFKGINEWIRFQKKTIRKNKMNENSSYQLEKYFQQSTEIIQISEDDLYHQNQDISFQDKTSFIQNMLTKVQKELQKQTGFNFIVQQDKEQDAQSNDQQFQDGLNNSFSQIYKNGKKQFQNKILEKTFKTNKDKNISNYCSYYDSNQTTFSQSDNQKSHKIIH